MDPPVQKPHSFFKQIIDPPVEKRHFDIEKQNLVVSGQNASCQPIIPYKSKATWKSTESEATIGSTRFLRISVIFMAFLLLFIVIATVVFEMKCHRAIAEYADGNKDELRKFRHPAWKVYGEVCGRPVKSPDDGSNIINGDDVQDIRKWPWTAYLSDLEQSFNCGAELITSQWALTAAHCVVNRFTVRQGLQITLGSLIRGDDSSPHSFQTQVAAIPHPRYDQFAHDYDIALLKLNEPVQISDYIRPICLTSSRQETVTYAPGSCWIIGWGLTSNFPFAVPPRNLQEAHSTLISPEQCRRYYDIISDNMICSSTANRSGACSGDSGGPMMCKNDDALWDLVGTTSWRFVVCADPSFPDVMARTSSFRDWIIETIDQNGGPGKIVLN